MFLTPKMISSISVLYLWSKSHDKFLSPTSMSCSSISSVAGCMSMLGAWLKLSRKCLKVPAAFWNLSMAASMPETWLRSWQKKSEDWTHWFPSPIPPPKYQILLISLIFKHVPCTDLSGTNLCVQGSDVEEYTPLLEPNCSLCVRYAN